MEYARSLGVHTRVKICMSISIRIFPPDIVYIRSESKKSIKFLEGTFLEEILFNKNLSDLTQILIFFHGTYICAIFMISEKYQSESSNPFLPSVGCMGVEEGAMSTPSIFLASSSNFSYSTTRRTTITKTHLLILPYSFIPLPYTVIVEKKATNQIEKTCTYFKVTEFLKEFMLRVYTFNL